MLLPKKLVIVSRSDDESGVRGCAEKKIMLPLDFAWNSTGENFEGACPNFLKLRINYFA